MATRIGSEVRRNGGSAKRPVRLYADPPIRRPAGQATTEILLLLPLFVILAGGAISIGYMCWQGIKVQQAANLAARIQGQERVGGGPSTASINQDNGITPGMEEEAPEDVGQFEPGTSMEQYKRPPSGGVYGKLYKAVHQMFGEGEQKKLFVPPPQTGMNTDSVKVTRWLVPGKIWRDWGLKPIKLEATAYGGEDNHMYALPRWGTTLNNGQGKPFWQDPTVLHKGTED